MDGETNVKFIPIEISEDCIEQEATKIIEHIRPKWKISDIKFKPLTDGLTNKLVKCFLKTNPENAVLIRVYGRKTNMLIDRKAEISNMILLHKENLCPQLYATLKNGLAYHFVSGVALTPETVIQPEIYSLVAAKMAELHLVNSPNKNSEPMLFEKILECYNLIPNKFTDTKTQNIYETMHYIYPKSKFLQEINGLKKRLVKLSSPIVFGHNDLLLENIIYNPDKKSVTFIDYEYAAMNYQAFDIGNHFVKFRGITDGSNGSPDKDLQFDWLRIYLRKYLGKSEVSQEEVEKLYVQVNQFSVSSNMLWGLWSLVQAEYSTIDFNYIEYGKMRLEQYLAAKHTRRT